MTGLKDMKTMYNTPVRLAFLILIGILSAEALEISGKWNSNETFFLFLSKFGFQKTNPHEGSFSEGYIFGNITTLDGYAGSTEHHQNDFITHESSGNVSAGEVKVSIGRNEGSARGMLVLLPRQFFASFYRNRSLAEIDPDLACQRMFKGIGAEAYEARCHDTGREDFLRHVPCEVGRLCPDEDNPDNVLPASQLTYAIKDVNNPRFWYLSLVACTLNATCGWEHSGGGVSLYYHLTLVNGRPPPTDHGFFAYHFSGEQQDVGELVLFCLVVYSCMLLPLQLWVTVKQERLPVLQMFLCVLLLQTLGLILAAGAQVVMGASGVWMGWAAASGEVCMVAGEGVFLLLLLLLARGWAVTNTTGHHTIPLYALWVTYTSLTLLLYYWHKVVVDVVEEVYKYGTWPGVLALLLRGVITVWYLWELRATMLSQQQPHILHFLLQFGAASLVWLVYVPVVALIAVQVSPLWRDKLMLGFRYSADLLAHVFMAYILYPRRSTPYLVLATPDDHCDELDVFNQAPHVLRRRHQRKGGRDSLGGGNSLGDRDSLSSGDRDSLGGSGRDGRVNRLTDATEVFGYTVPVNENGICGGGEVYGNVKSCGNTDMYASTLLGSSSATDSEDIVEFDRKSEFSSEVNTENKSRTSCKSARNSLISPQNFSSGHYSKETNLEMELLKTTNAYMQLEPLPPPPRRSELTHKDYYINGSQATNRLPKQRNQLQDVDHEVPQENIRLIQDVDLQQSENKNANFVSDDDSETELLVVVKDNVNESDDPS